MQTDSSQVSILMVDDNESNLLALETILQGPDRNLVRAASGEAALQYLLHNDAAVILLDVRMPGISGLETAELIRGSKKTRDLPIIFLTAYDRPDREDLSRGYSLGAVDYIIKPLDPEALKSKVAVFVELYKKTEQVKQQAALLHEKNIQLEIANFERLGKLVELGQRLTAERDPETLLQLVCEAAADILAAQDAYVIMENDGYTVSHTVCEPADDAEPERSKRLIERSELSAFSSRSGPVRVSSTESAAGMKAAREAATGPLLSAPLSLLGETIGWLYLVRKPGAPEFSEADERLALTLAGQLAVAHENARLYAEARNHGAKLLAEVTERKQAELEKERLLVSEKAARLEAEEAQRMSARLLVREENARAEAEAANRLKDEFLATVSHELRTPLNSILGWAQLLRTGTIDDAASARALMTIERNTKTLAQIIDDLLDVSRIISGKLRLDVRPVRLESIVDAALESVRPAVDAKNIHIQVLLDPGVGAVSGDPNRLQQIVWNLLSNAIKFTPGNGTVSVNLERIESHATITVADTGEGINPSFLPYVFDRFSQADGTFARSHGGLGLGLAIVRHLVELHGGAVTADSQGKGKGATFTVAFPLVDPDENARVFPILLADVVKPVVEEPKDLSGLSVLIVDDEPDVREVIVAVLELRGARVIAAASAAEAIEMLSNATNGALPDVLVSDLAMPGEDGFKLIEMVRRLDPERGGNIPAIALTAYARSEDSARVLAAGFQRHVAKPVEPASLATAVASLASPPAKG